MSTHSHSDFDMLRLEPPRDILQITDGSAPTEGPVEFLSPAVWVRSLVRQQQQAEEDLRHLAELCGNTIDHTDRRIQRIERAYQTLADGSRYLYDRVTANEAIADEWIRSELSTAANAYQTFAREVWAAIMEKTTEADQRLIHQATQLARINDALAFLGEANTARNQHLAAFQGNVEVWAANHQKRVATLESQLQEARGQIQRLATRIPLPRTPSPPPPPPGATPPQWRSPARPSSTSMADALQRLTTIPTTPPGRFGSPFVPSFNRRTRPPAVPPVSPPRPPRGPMFGGGPPGPPRPPRRLPTPPPRSPSPPRQPSAAPQPIISPADLVQLVAEGVTRAQMYAPPRPERANTSRLKMENPEKFDGKSTSTFNQWWESVVMYLGFYPETVDRQKIAWIGTLLTDTALVWHLHRYRELGDTDTWERYAAALRAEYHNEREAADAQMKLGQLRYQGSIRAYLTEFRALNTYARATGEALKEKIDLAMTSEILKMRFAHYLGEFADDEGFLQATYQAGLQVERMKALEKAREGNRPPKQEEKKKDGQERRTPDKARKGKETDRAPRPEQRDPGNGRRQIWGAKDRWVSKDEALKGVPPKEQEEYGASEKDCWRCGRPGHRTFDCFSFETRRGTKLPPAPWKTSAVSTEKRKRSEEPEVQPAAKQQKIAAVETMDTEAIAPLWDDSESDF
jgi:hypothetical protein